MYCDGSMTIMWSLIVFLNYSCSRTISLFSTCQRT